MVAQHAYAEPVDRLDPALESPPGAAAERRLHGRAHAYWRSLLGKTRFPLIEDLDLAGVPRLAETSVLFGVETQDDELAINLVGASIRAAWEGPESPMARLIAQVRLRLPVLTAHGKPIGFEAELAGEGGLDTAYRGILLPFGRGGETVDYVLMVVSWKERVDAARDPALLAAELFAGSKRPRDTESNPWEGQASPSLPPVSYEQKITSARTWAALARTGGPQKTERSNKAVAAAYGCMILSSRLTPLAAMDSIFGRDLPRAVRCYGAAVLRYARRLCLSEELLEELLEDLGGPKVVAAMEWRVRRARPPHSSRHADHFLLTEPVRAQDRSLSPWRGREGEPIAVDHIVPKIAGA